ncbi:hypothetical protein HPB47_010391, partial [Ixodes persulcatus]
MEPHRGGIDARERHRRRPACPPSDPQKIRLFGCWPRWRQPPFRCLDSSPSQQHVASSCGPKLRTRADKQFASRHRLSDTARATWPSFKQAVGVVVINGVGFPDTRNHEAEFPEGAGSPLPILAYVCVMQFSQQYSEPYAGNHDMEQHASDEANLHLAP